MATRGPVQVQITTTTTTQLCDFCHQKPKFSNHQYCSKTCASQASSLCKHCQKKPKFQNFDYCGKNCAASAQQGVVANPVQVQQQAPVPKAATSNAKTNPSKTFNPIQAAKLVAQHIPQVLGSSNGAPSAPAAQPTGQASAPSVTHNNNPFLNLTNQSQPAQQPVANSASTQSQFNTQPPPQCLIPGCGKPVHVDTQGSTTSDYCSRKHREEAVVIGLASPCIMCLTMPQSDIDYFCGKACRDEALNKV